MSRHISLEDLSAHLDAALPPARRDLVEAHLAGCAQCREEQASLAWAADFARALPLVEPPPGSSFRVPIDVEAAEARLPGRERPRWPWFAALALGAVVLLAAIGLGRWMTTAPAQGPADARAGLAATTLPPPSTEAPLALDVLGTRLSATDQPLDIDTASRIAGGLVLQGDGAEAQTRPLATALTADRARRVEGEAARAGVLAAPPAASPGAGSPVPGADATAPASIDRGGYAPPDAPIPGRPGARGSRSTAAQATAARSSAPVGGQEPPPPGTQTAWAATNTIDRARSAETGTAAPQASPTRSVAPSATPPAPPSTTPPAPPSTTPPAPPSTTPSPVSTLSQAVPSRSLLVPLSALSIGFLALGILLFRQARARRRRRAWRQG